MLKFNSNEKWWSRAFERCLGLEELMRMGSCDHVSDFIRGRETQISKLFPSCHVVSCMWQSMWCLETLLKAPNPPRRQQPTVWTPQDSEPQPSQTVFFINYSVYYMWLSSQKWTIAPRNACLNLSYGLKKFLLLSGNRWNTCLNLAFCIFFFFSWVIQTSYKQSVNIMKIF